MPAAASLGAGLLYFIRLQILSRATGLATALGRDSMAVPGYYPRIRNSGGGAGLPVPDRPDIHMNEVRAGIKTCSAAFQ